MQGSGIQGWQEPEGSCKQVIPENFIKKAHRFGGGLCIFMCVHGVGV